MSIMINDQNLWKLSDKIDFIRKPTSFVSLSIYNMNVSFEIEDLAYIFDTSLTNIK